MPDSFATTADGRLLVANGIDPVLRWDGLTDEMQEAGIEAPTEQLSLAASGSGTITGTYYAYLRYVDDRGEVSNLSPVSAALTAASKATITYTNVELPLQQNKVRRRQILRNTTGQTRAFYVDVDTEDLTSTSFSSTRTDANLRLQEVVALLDVKNNPIAELHTPPPDTKAFLAAHHERMFMAGEEAYSVGSVALTFGSATVTGHGTEWPVNFAGRFLWVPQAEEVYEIDSVDTANQTLTLTTPYQGVTDPYTAYSIRPAAAERRLVYFSEAGEPEAWPAANAISPQEDGDEIVGIMSKGSFVYFLERRHIYRLTFQDSPTEDGFIFLTAGRGAANNRCFVVVDDVAYLLDEAGVYSFSGGQQVQELSGPIQDLFEPARGTRKPRYRIRWEAARWFHGCLDPGQRLIRFFVTLEGTGLPRHCLAFDITSQRWWVEEYPFPVGASCVGVIRGARRVLLGGPGGRVYVLGEGTLDVVDGGAQTVRGTASSARHTKLTDTQASFTSACVNSPLRIVAGRGKGQVRTVVAASATTLTVSHPWLVKPDTTSVYQVGGVRYRYRTGRLRYTPSDRETPRGLEVLFEPCEFDSLLDARLYLDRSADAEVWDFTQTQAQSDQFAVTDGETDWVADLTKPLGVVRRRVDGRKEQYLDGPRFASWELSGVTNRDEVALYQLTLDGHQGGGS